ncbi:hypothetical protein ETI05_03530 [Macrococcoides canis]|uniref:hypothetical protein n=1 Tax=Macrococcoides canis TaxID=1855823 RepID=UPI00105C9949|nr:hypothetical protein [Macrococcus canis]TDM21826.1 hypothetical protein ETI05_03530 [Macrococcus canis]
MNTINVYDGNGNLVAYSYHIGRERIEPENDGWIEFIKHYPGSSDEVIQKIKLYAKDNMYVEGGTPCFKYKNEHYYIPSECYEIYEGKAQESIPLSEIFEQLEKENDE